MILFVDDETRRFHSHRFELEDALKPHFIDIVIKRDIDAARSFFEENQNDLDLIILDIMMAPGESFKDTDTESGLRTGVVFFDYIRERKADVPIVIFSNVTHPSVVKHFLQKPHCKYLQKIDVAPLDLVDVVMDMLKIGNDPKGEIDES